MLLWLSRTRWRYRRIGEGERLPRPGPLATPEPGSPGTVRWLLAAVTALALFLRLLKVGSDLWLDEILLVMVYRTVSVLQVIASYLSSNNHLLYTLLMKVSVGLFGEEEWAIRLAAVLFGTATVPVLYWVARLLMMSRWASLSASLLLALSYHHIFFSQNARGYSGYIFFSLLSSGLLLRALQEDRLQLWASYVLATLLNLALLLNSALVLLSHALVSLAVAFRVHRAGSSPTPLLRRLMGVFALIGLLGFQLYATALPTIYVFVTTAYAAPEGGYAPFSLEFLAELARGVSAGFGTGMLLGAIPFLLLAGWGGLRLLRNQWVLATSLGLPVLFTALYLLAQGLMFTPRFFILALPIAVLAATQAIFAFARWTSSRLGKGDTVLPHALAATVVLAASAVSLASLPYYYTVPKQPYRASIQYLRMHREPGMSSSSSTSLRWATASTADVWG
jgi:4-amino-4-deoxy-L-arabinose transferase-like glycosyltransferase